MLRIWISAMRPLNHGTGKRTPIHKQNRSISNNIQWLECHRWRRNRKKNQDATILSTEVFNHMYSSFVILAGKQLIGGFRHSMTHILCVIYMYLIFAKGLEISRSECQFTYSLWKKKVLNTLNWDIKHFFFVKDWRATSDNVFCVQNKCNSETLPFFSKQILSAYEYISFAHIHFHNF